MTTNKIKAITFDPRRPHTIAVDHARGGQEGYKALRDGRISWEQLREIVSPPDTGI